MKRLLLRTAKWLFILAYLVSAIIKPPLAMAALTSNDLSSVVTNTALYSPTVSCDEIAAATPTLTNTTAAGTSNTYTTAGNIPATGIDVGTTTYGGQFANGNWSPSNDQQGGITPHDDNGMGNDGKPLPGRTAYAELGNGQALGGLPNGTKLEISYNGKSIVAEKDDIGAGGGPINGKERALDLWWETARLLDFTSGSGVVTIRAVDPNTALTPITGQATTSGGAVAGTPGSIYMLGDSITEGIQTAGLATKFPQGWGPVTIDGSQSRSLTAGGTTGNGKSPADAIKADTAAITSAKVLIVGLGTNPGGSVDINQFAAQIDQIIDQLRAINASANIYWVNYVSTSSPQYPERNTVLGTEATRKNFTVIDAKSKNIPLGGDGIHPTADGYKAMVDAIVAAVTSETSGSASSLPKLTAGGSCCPSSTASGAGGGTISSVVLTGNTNAEKIWNFLTGKSQPGIPPGSELTPEQAAGVMGSLMQESSLNPAAVEGGGTGIGLVQWSFGRHTALIQAAQAKGVPWQDMAFQLNFLYEESNARTMRKDSNTKEWIGLRTQTHTVDEAVAFWEYNSERAGIFGARYKYAHEIYQQFTGNPAPGTTPITGSTSASSGGGSAATCTASTTGTVDIIQKISFQESRTITPTALVLHWWGGTSGGNIDSLIGTLQNRGLAVQIGTTIDGKVYQLMPQLNSYAPHAKCANSWAIGNEIEGGASFGLDPLGSGQTVALDLANNQAQFQAVVNVTMQLMAKFNIPLDGPLAKDGSSGVGVHSHKEVDVNCQGANGKQDVDDVYLKRVKDEIKKRLANGDTGGRTTQTSNTTPGVANAGTVGSSECSSNVQLTGGPGSACDGLNNTYTPAQLKTLADLRAKSKEPPLTDIVTFGTTRVHKSIAGNLQKMVDDAKKAGVNLDAVVGFRSFDGQVYERTVFCGKTFDDIYIKSAGSCTPSVAIPGQSNHQKGLAIDFGVNNVTNDPGFANTKDFAWLKANASKYGFKNLASEPWHWSTDGQ